MDAPCNTTIHRYIHTPPYTYTCVFNPEEINSTHSTEVYTYTYIHIHSRNQFNPEQIETQKIAVFEIDSTKIIKPRRNYHPQRRRWLLRLYLVERRQHHQRERGSELAVLACGGKVLLCMGFWRGGRRDSWVRVFGAASLEVGREETIGDSLTKGNPTLYGFQTN